MEYRLINTRAKMPSGDKQQSVSVRKLPLSDLPNGTRNVITSPQGSSPLPKEEGPVSVFPKSSGMKRHPSDYPASPHHPPTFKSGTNGHLVYVRRKIEETGKASTSGDTNTVVSPKAGKFRDSEKRGLSCQPDQVQESRISCSPAVSPLAAAALTASSCGTSVPVLGRPTTGFLLMEPNCSLITSGNPVKANSPGSNRVHWKERFIRLQMFLNSRDQASQEEYIQMLRSLSAVGRSKHAVELEKRAIHLLLEEGKELHRMKLLNVLGKVSPNHV